MNKKGFAFIFARKGSKGLPGKNTRALGGRPLIEWTLNYLCESDKIDKICISSDDEFIITRYTSSYNAKIIAHDRPAHLAGDTVTTEQVLIDACQAMTEYIKDHHFGVYMQITEPYRPKDILDLCVSKYISTEHDTVFAATEYHKNFWVERDTKIERVANENDFNKPRQCKVPLIREDTGVCLVADMSIFARGSRIGENPSFVLYHHLGSLIDIHDADDLKLAQLLFDQSFVTRDL